jgi:ribosomal protein S18 acetylase RimI-like enzyme
MRDDPDHQPSLDLVAVADDGTLAGMCYCSIAGLEASRGSTIEGRTEPIAVDRDFQRQGLGRALVVAGLTALRDHGAQSVALTTEVDNDAAHRLYNSLGYRELYRARWYNRSDVADRRNSHEPV